MTGDGWRSRARAVLLGPRALLLGGVVVASATAGLALTSALSGGPTPQGVVVEGRPNLASYQSGGNRNETANANPDASFTIAGNASELLYPGTSSTIDLAFTNKTGTAITLPASAITVTITSPRSTCPASPNFTLVQTLTQAITIPNGATDESLAAMGIAPQYWPVISMMTTHVNQDACEGMTLTLHYSATVTSTGPVTAGTTGTGSGSQSGGSTTVPVQTATGATSGGPLAFTGFDVLLYVSSGVALVLFGIGLLAWRRRLGAPPYPASATGGDHDGG